MKIWKLCAQIGSTTVIHLKQLPLVLGMNFYRANILSKKKPAIRRRMRNPCKLKTRCYAAGMFELNKHLSIFPGEESSKQLMRQNWIVLFLTIHQMDGVSKRMFTDLILKLLFKKICGYIWEYWNCWNYLWRCSRNFLSKENY